MEPRLLLACLGAALTTCGGSGLDVETATVFRGDAGGDFGRTLAQFGTSDDGGVLVGAPAQRGADGRLGRIYRCRYRTGTCQEVPVAGPPGAVNESMGLALASGDAGALVCGPTAPQTCGENVHLNGFCVLLDANLQQLRLLPVAQRECPKRSSDLVLLIDGSGSIAHRDFLKMKTFVAEVMRRFEGTDTQFALTQFSSNVYHHFDFDDFRRSPDPLELLKKVTQLRGSTRTATAIRDVLTQTFAPGKGAREDAKKILVVITDGEKNGDPLEYSDVIPLANEMGVTRYAIGVGSAFSQAGAVAELQAIASPPGRDHVFRVDNFEALQGIQAQLQEKIFAIEGTRSALGSSFQLEMAQEGFSALLAPEGPVLGAVGAYDWAGGVFVYGGGGGATTFLNASGDMSDAYLGYAAESLALGGRPALALGAPRYRHVGRLLLFHRPGPGATWQLLAEATGTQVGSYFGASLCALDTDGDGGAEVLLVGAPMFYGDGSGGRVAACSLREEAGQLRCQQSLRGQPGHPLGRFGASLGRLGDVDGDGWPEVAVGAPLEDEERGAVYVFRGEKGGLAPQYSQRISGAAFSPRPRHWGQALSGGRDLTGDALPDVAVGARGQVLLLRSRPLLKVLLRVTFQPQEIPAAALDCPEEEEEEEEEGGGRRGGGAGRGGAVAQATICFNGTKKTPDGFGSQPRLTLRYRALLDPGRAVPRAVFVGRDGGGGGAAASGSLRLGVGQSCRTLAVAVPGCPRDALTPLGLRLSYEAAGEPMAGAGGLRPGLSRDSDTEAVGTLPFAKACGPDGVCVDDLHVTLDFSGLQTLLVGATPALAVTLRLRNGGESSYGGGLRLRHPRGLPYRRARLLQASRRSLSPRCHSEPPEGPWARTLCLLPPVFPPGAQVTFAVTLEVPPGVELGDAIEVVANASSASGAGGGHSARLPVKYGLGLRLLSAPDSVSSVAVSGGAPPNVTHHYEVKVWGQRGPAMDVAFLVPTALGGTPLWDQVGVTPQQELVRCRAGDELPGAPHVPPGLRELSCPTATCRQFWCRVPPLEPPQALGFHLGGRLGLRWVQQTPQPRVVLQSSARVLYDVGRYWNSGGEPRLQIQTELELAEPPSPLPHILGGSVGGLLLLALLTLGLYKLGFFRRRYKELMEGDETPPAPPADPQG